MKFKTTKKAMKEGYYNIISIGYCNAQHLLNYENPTSYSTRAEGWACDYYEVNNVLISTGYAPVNALRTKYDYKVLREYDDKARTIQYNNSMDYQEQKKQVTALLDKFVKEATE
jgi:hypothetical protein